MLQTFLTEPYHIEFKDTKVPEPGRGEVLIKLKMVGVCGSDVHMFKNGHVVDRPLTIGHEGIGVIEKTGEGISLERVGERVVIEPNIPCGTCPECWSGKGNICRNKRIIGVHETGCFAEYISLPSEFVHTLPSAISDVDAVAIEPATVALSALFRSKAKPGDTIGVIGLGAIGLLLTHIALKLGYRVLVTELMEEKLNRALEMGAVFAEGGKTPKETSVKLEILYQKEGVTSVFECAGSSQSATMAIEAAPRGAEIILLGLSTEPAYFNPRLISRKGNSIVPSLIYDHPFDFQRCIQLIERGIIHPGFVVSKYFSVKNLTEALTEAVKGKESKIVVKTEE